ncbi:MAG: sulfite exporter TauE/SafE family protein [Pseudomonadota bacterium]
MTYLLLALTGAFAGLLGGLFGIGGGIIIVPVLFAILTGAGGDPEVAAKTAVATSLATIIMTSLRSLRAHHKKGAVDVDVLKIWMPFIAIGAIGGAGLARFIDGQVLVAFFGLSALGMGLQRLLKRDRSGGPKKTFAFSLPLQRSLAVITGVVSSLLGIGGGVMGVMLMTLSGRPIHQAVGTASGFGIAIALPGAITLFFLGLSDTALPGAVSYLHVPGLIAIALGTLMFVPLGAHLAHRASQRHLSIAFGLFLLAMSANLLREAAVSF